MEIFEGTIRRRVEDLLQRVSRATRKSGRLDSEVRVIAVSKGHSAECVVEAYRAGLRVFGENKVQEAAGKIPRVASLLSLTSQQDLPCWHLVGHLQTNKVRAAASLFAMVHSVDSIRLAKMLNRAVGTAAQTRSCQPLPVLLEVNVAGEQSKYGFSPERLLVDAAGLVEMEWIRVDGLMTVAPLANAQEEVRPVFRELRRLREELSRRYPDLPLCHLSMGMSDDYEVAIEEGATLIRVGRAIFGERS